MSKSKSEERREEVMSGEQPAPVEVIEKGFVYSFVENGQVFEGHRERFEDAEIKDRFVVFPSPGQNGYSCPLDQAVLFQGLTKLRPA